VWSVRLGMLFRCDEFFHFSASSDVQVNAMLHCHHARRDHRLVDHGDAVTNGFFVSSSARGCLHPFGSFSCVVKSHVLLPWTRAFPLLPNFENLSMTQLVASAEIFV
jgi:hypothetical protein